MRTFLVLVLVLVTSAAAVTPSLAAPPDSKLAFARSSSEGGTVTAGSPAVASDAAHGFGPVVLVSSNAFETGGEPGIDVAPDGTLYENGPSGLGYPGGSFLYKSTDGGSTWTKCPDSNAQGGGDSNVAINRDGVIAMNDLWLTSLSVSVSMDGCKTWQMVPITTTYLDGDRQWIEFGNDACEFFQSWYQFGTGVRVMHSIDCGLTWVDLLAVGSVDLIGNLVADHSGESDNVYQFYTRSGQIRVAIVTKREVAGVETPLLTSVDRIVAQAQQGHTLWDSFPAGVVDAGGTVHAVWQDRQGSGASANSEIRYARSTDGGLSWSTPIVISTGGSNVFPWIDGGAEGKVNAVWYHSDVPGQPDGVAGPWFVHLSQSLDNGATWTESRVTPLSIHNDNICTSGTGCTGDDRDLLDFFEVAHDASGNAVISFTKDSDANGLGNGDPKNAFVKQVSGPTIV